MHWATMRWSVCELSSRSPASQARKGGRTGECGRIVGETGMNRNARVAGLALLTALPFTSPMGQAMGLLDRAAITRYLESKVDDRLAGAEAGPLVDMSDLRGADLLSHIYHRRYGMANVSGLENAEYVGQIVSGLVSQCPSLDLGLAELEMVPYFLAAATHSVLRVATGRGSRKETGKVIWGTLLTLHDRSQCVYDVSSGELLSDAQRRCDDATRTTNALYSPSPEGRHDVDWWLRKYSCDSAQTRHLSGSIVKFAKRAHRQTYLDGRVPDLDTPAGRPYGEIFGNCARQAPDNEYDEWCACYVRKLSNLSPSPAVLASLARNPFVDGSYLTSMVGAVPRGATLYECNDETPRRDFWRDGLAPRTTACLIREESAGSGEKRCHYRSAWAEFFLTGKQCESEISSKRWGYREVDCGRQASEVAPTIKPREWKDRVFQFVDYESEVPDDFAPELPKDGFKRAPLFMRFLKRETEDLIKSVSVVEFTSLADFGGPIMGEGVESDVLALYEEKAVVLTCGYAAGPGFVRNTFYWYKTVPRLVRSGKVHPESRPYLNKIRGAAENCPLRRPR